MAYVCQACAANEALVRAFATRQMAEWQGQQLRFRRLPFIKRTVFDVVFADLAHSVEDGSVVAAVSDGGNSRGGG